MILAHVNQRADILIIRFRRLASKQIICSVLTLTFQWSKGVNWTVQHRRRPALAIRSNLISTMLPALNGTVRDYLRSNPDEGCVAKANYRLPAGDAEARAGSGSLEFSSLMSVILYTDKLAEVLQDQITALGEKFSSSLHHHEEPELSRFLERFLLTG